VVYLCTHYFNIIKRFNEPCEETLIDMRKLAESGRISALSTVLMAAIGVFELAMGFLLGVLD
jgi:hypothetical protein